MVGVAYFKKEDAKVIANGILEAYQHKGHEQLYWDEVVDAKLDSISLGIKPVLGTQIVEIDTVDELIAIDSSYKK